MSRWYYRRPLLAGLALYAAYVGVVIWLLVGELGKQLARQGGLGIVILALVFLFGFPGAQFLIEAHWKYEKWEKKNDCSHS